MHGSFHFALMKIALDAMGGDRGSAPNLAGAQLALTAYPKISKLFLVGDEATLKRGMAEIRLQDRRIEIVHASEVVEMSDEAIASVRRKKDSSISRAVDLVKSGDAGAVVSAGHTGAAVAAAFFKLRCIPGVGRPGILSPFPNLVNPNGICYLIDAGANVDAKPEHLIQQAIMGSVYVSYVHGTKTPRVGLMSNGEEDSKGNAVTKEVFEFLSSLRERGFGFKGNVEGRDLFAAPIDVAVCDGFVGNVLLKGCEGTAKAIKGLIKTEFTKWWLPWRIIGALLTKGALKEAGQRLNYENYGGSPLLGVNGVCIIAHGSSGPIAIKNALRVGAECLEHEVNPHIAEAISAYLSSTAPVPAGSSPSAL
jgi:phosphate acyltransferase